MKTGKQNKDYYEALGSLDAWEEAQYQRDVVMPRREFFRNTTSTLSKIIAGGLVFGGLSTAAIDRGSKWINDYYAKKSEELDMKIDLYQSTLDEKVKLGVADFQISELKQAQEALKNEYSDFVDNARERIGSEFEGEIVQRDRTIDKLQIKLDEFYEREKANPARYSLGEGSAVLDVAKTIFCEAMGEWKSEDYQFNIGSTPRVRANLTGLSIPEIIAFNKQNKEGKIVESAYSFTNPSNDMHRYFLNPLVDAEDRPLDYRAWEASYDRARIIMCAPFEEIPQITHFYVDSVAQPDWAAGRKPLDIITLNGKTTRFYYIPEHFKKLA